MQSNSHMQYIGMIQTKVRNTKFCIKDERLICTLPGRGLDRVD